MPNSVFNTENKSNHLQAQAFLDPNGGVTLQRFDVMKYRQFDKLTQTQLGFFWRPEEIDLSRDANDFKLLSEHEKHIFTSNLKRQILLDSVQGRSPNLAFLPIVSLPEIEAWITTWAFSETIHSRSYTHIIRNIYPNPSKIFDEISNISEIIDCAKDISHHYDNLIKRIYSYKLEIHFSGLYSIKKALWLTLMSVNILEGIRFFASFACAFAFAELKKMEGNAKIIKLITRDEGLHLAGTQLLLKLLQKEDSDFAQISQETEPESIELFRGAVNQEKDWARFLFSGGSIIGLNEKILSEYLEYLANKRLNAIGLASIFEKRPNPLPWMNRWIYSSETQVAPQEVAITSYTIGDIHRDIKSDSFEGFKL